MSKRLKYLVLVILILLVSCQNDDEIVITPTTTKTSLQAEPTASSLEDGNNVPPIETVSLVPTTSLAPADLTIPNEPITLRLGIEDQQQVTYESLIEAFEEENPNIHVELVTQTDLLDGKFFSDLPPEESRRKLAAGADVIALYTTGSSIREGLRLDLTPFIIADNSFDPDDYYFNQLEQYQWEGKTWAIPLDISFDLLVYNANLFDEAGIEYPDSNWNWDEFLDKATALTNREDDEVAQWGYLDKYIGITPIPPSLTGPLLVSDLSDPRPRFDNPEFVEGVQWYTDLFVTHKVALAPEGDLSSLETINAFLSQSFNLIRTNKVAMWRENSTFLSSSFIPNNSNWGIVPLPGCSPAYSSTLSISAGTQNPAAAWHLVNFLSQQFTVAGSINDVPKMPARQSIAEAGGFYDMVRSDLADAFRYAVDHACPTYKTSEILGSYEANSALQKALTETFTEGKPVEIALVEAQSAAEVAIEDLLVLQANATPIPPPVVVSTDGAIANEDVVVIRFHVFGGPQEIQVYRDLARQFMDSNPGIFIEVESTENNSSLLDNAAQADCFQGFSNFNRNEITSILNLEPFFDIDTNTNRNDFYPLTLNAFTEQGLIWGVPGQIDVPIIAFNKSLFDAADLSYPQMNWTTADFLAIAQILTQGEGENKQYGFMPGAFEATDILDWLERLGANLLERSEAPTKITLADPSVVTALQWYTDLTSVYGIRPSFESGVANLQNNNERRVLIEDGRVGMWIDSTFSQGGFPLDSENVGFVPLPVGINGDSYLSIHSLTGYFISVQANVEQRQGCWDWIIYLTDQPVFGELPASKSTALSPEYASLVGNERALAQLEMLTTNQEVAVSTWLENSNGWLIYPFSLSNDNLTAQIITRIISDQTSVEQALAAAQERLDIYQECILENEIAAALNNQMSCWQLTVTP